MGFIFVIKANWLFPLLNVLHFVGILNDLCTHPTGKQWFSLHYKIVNTGILRDFNLYSAWIIYALNQADFILLHSEEQRHFCVLFQCKCKVWRRRMGSRSHATLASCYCCFSAVSDLSHNPPTVKRHRWDTDLNTSVNYSVFRFSHFIWFSWSLAQPLGEQIQGGAIC